MKLRTSRGPLVALGILLLVAWPAAGFAQTERLRIDFDPPALPEGLATDGTGTLYVGIATSGEIRRVSSVGQQSKLATLRIGLGSLLGLIYDDRSGALFAALNSRNTPGSDTHGVWRVGLDGSTSLLAAMPATTMPNGLALGSDGMMYVSDSARGSIWRIAADGSAAQWVQDSLLAGDLQTCPPPVLTAPIGANGLAITADGSLLVANTTRAQVVRVPVLPDGSAGQPSLAYGPDCATLGGVDGLLLDADGVTWATLNWQDRIVRLEPSGAVTTVATKADGLDFPASLVSRQGRLIVTNYAQLTYLNNTSPKPSLLGVSPR